MSKGLIKVFSRLFVSVVVVCAMMPVSAWAQSPSNVTLKMDNVSLEAVLDALEQQSGLLFLNDRVDLTRTVSVDVTSEPVEKVLDRIFAGKGIDYSVRGTNIYISNKTEDKSDKNPGGKVSGTVVDATGMPLIGVAVLIKGTTTGTGTDFDGKFEFDLPNGTGGVRY